MSRPNHHLARENAEKIIKRADGLSRVGGWDCIDYPVAVAYLAKVADVALLRARLSEALAMLEESTSLEEALQPFRDAINQTQEVG